MTKYSDFNNRIKVHKETRCQLFKSKQNFSKVFKMRHTYNNNSMDFCLLLYKLKLNQHKPRWGISLVTTVYSFCGAVRTREEEDAETLSVFFWEKPQNVVRKLLWLHHNDSSLCVCLLGLVWYMIYLHISSEIEAMCIVCTKFTDVFFRTEK